VRAVKGEGGQKQTHKEKKKLTHMCGTLAFADVPGGGGGNVSCWEGRPKEAETARKWDEKNNRGRNSKKGMTERKENVKSQTKDTTIQKKRKQDKPRLTRKKRHGMRKKPSSGSRRACAHTEQRPPVNSKAR